MNVAVIGASNRPEKYSYLALRFLKEAGHRAFAVHPALRTIEGDKVYASIREIPEPVDTVTLYVSPQVSSRLGEEILGTSPRRIIFNPGAENPELEAKARARGITTVRACTLTLLKTDQF
ncbi:MAG: CoA-binding protein [Candidatus Omnitrophica bacterium]|nr:CoA-binding protein [Candidatus Omnitrophota bacterium]